MEIFSSLVARGLKSGSGCGWALVMVLSGYSLWGEESLQSAFYVIADHTGSTMITSPFDLRSEHCHPVD